MWQHTITSAPSQPFLPPSPPPLPQFFQRAIAVDPSFVYAYTLCGHEYVCNEDLEKAVACYRYALRLDERHYNAWYVPPSLPPSLLPSLLPSLSAYLA